MAMMRKHYLSKKRMKKMLCCEILQPIIFGVLLYLLPYLVEWTDGQGDDYSRQLLLPMFFAFFLPNVSSVASRFIAQSLVTEKQQKIRETLKLMSLTTKSYGLSYMIL